MARGLARPPPVAITIEDGIAGPANPDADWQAFDDWSLTACPHPRMEVVSDRAGNWAGVCELAAVCDLDGTATVTCPWPHVVETSYEVIEHVETAADHEHTLAVLEGLFRAAIEHDTCVVWC